MLRESMGTGGTGKLTFVKANKAGTNKARMKKKLLRAGTAKAKLSDPTPHFPCMPGTSCAMGGQTCCKFECAAASGGMGLTAPTLGRCFTLEDGGECPEHTNDNVKKYCPE
ncbi:unnamed protein product [Amoebophrya sp. A120]|nr:unnamed protein product [Amoebophrya sp. A120]|eukprot:GSA120T00021877001.1